MSWSHVISFQIRNGQKQELGNQPQIMLYSHQSSRCNHSMPKIQISSEPHVMVYTLISSKSLFLPKFGQFDAAYNRQPTRGWWSDLQFALIFFPQILRKASIPVIRGDAGDNKDWHSLWWPGTLAVVRSLQSPCWVSTQPVRWVPSARSGRLQLYLGTPGGNMCHPPALTRLSSANQVTADTKWA